jgi:PAS domain-containing protein
MKPGRNSARLRWGVIGGAAVVVWVVILLLQLVARAQHSEEPRRVLVLYWYNKDHPWNFGFDRSFQEALQKEPAGTVEYYAEYLESNRFPGENQSLLLRDNLRQKYADRTIDVIVATSDASLDFLLKYRKDLFPNTPIVFVVAKHPDPKELLAGPGMSGVINVNSNKQTLDLALRLHPGTRHVFVITGTIQRDKKFETLAREELQGYESSVQITYLTDLAPDELIAETRGLPERSIVLYVWQQSQDEQGKILESLDILALIARSAKVPVYRVTSPYIDGGIVGGYVNTGTATAPRVAEIALRIANGTRAQDIPVERAATVAMFDWRELKRWGISEDDLPPGSIVRFKEVSLWELYKWRIVGVLALCAIEALLIVALLLQRARSRRAEESQRLSEEKFSKAFRSSPDAFLLSRSSDGAILEVNDRLEALVGFSRIEAIGRTTVDLDFYVRLEDEAEYRGGVAAQR